MKSLSDFIIYIYTYFFDEEKRRLLDEIAMSKLKQKKMKIDAKNYKALMELNLLEYEEEQIRILLNEDSEEIKKALLSKYYT